MQLFKSIFQAPAQIMQIIRFYMALRLPNFSLVEDPAMGIFNSILNTNFKQKHLQKKKKKRKKQPKAWIKNRPQKEIVFFLCCQMQYDVA